MIEESMKNIMNKLDDMGFQGTQILALRNFREKELTATEIIDFNNKGKINNKDAE